MNDMRGIQDEWNLLGKRSNAPDGPTPRHGQAAAMGRIQGENINTQVKNQKKNPLNPKLPGWLGKITPVFCQPCIKHKN